MTEALRKPDWIPYYIQRMKGSKAYKELTDVQFGWYSKLLIELADSDVPGYLVNDVRTLWRLAGARTEKFFRERGGMELVARYFSRTDDGLHIYNQRMLVVLHEQMKKLHKRKSLSVSSFNCSLQELPEWIPGECFMEYLEMRKSIDKPMKTGRALKIAINKLATLKLQGHDPQAVLEQSIFNSWQGLFPIRQVTNGLRGPGAFNVAGAPANGNGGTSEKKSTIDPQCATCRGTGFDLSSGKAVTCACRKRGQNGADSGAANGRAVERAGAYVASAGRDFKAASANDR